MKEKFTAIKELSFKDAHPLDTVERIKSILKANHIETEEHWLESGVPNCFALSVRVVGSAFGTNGKGLTKELALASGYGELMERLQLGYIFREDHQKDPAVPARSANAEMIPIDQLLSRNEKWYSIYTDALYKQTGIRLSNRDLLMQYADSNGNISATSYYCLNTQSNEYLPDVLREAVYTTNGCAAGNTMEEAVVQAISEIIERHYKLRILSEEIPLPDIPEDILKSCKAAYEIITYLRSNGFRVAVKDGSLGTKYPVICVCLFDQKTGRYHTHFGAYPSFEVALSRTLTETFQGRNIKSVAQFDSFYSADKTIFDLQYLANELVYGTAEKKPEFFLTSKDLTYVKTAGFSSKGNQALLLECVSFIQDLGYDILIRDCSCLGFPTYQVVIPGLSETFLHRLDNRHNDNHFRGHTASVLKNPAAAKLEDIMGFMMHLSWMGKRGVYNHTFSKLTNIPAQISKNEDARLMNASLAHVFYTLGRYKDTIKHVNQLLLLNKKDNQTEDDAQLICIKQYLSLKTAKHSDEDIRSLLSMLHSTETTEWLYSCISNNNNPFDAFTLHCDEKCAPSCRLFNTCKKNQMAALTRMIQSKQKAMSNDRLKEHFQQLIAQTQNN